jgi:hypothetical protein
MKPEQVADITSEPVAEFVRMRNFVPGALADRRESGEGDHTGVQLAP